VLRWVAFRAGPPARVPVLLGTCRACFLCGRSGSGPDPVRAGPGRPGPGPGRPRSGPTRARGIWGFRRWTWAAAGRPNLGMLGSARTVPTLRGHSLSACLATL
jgi:hypothetical protein